MFNGRIKAQNHLEPKIQVELVETIKDSVGNVDTTGTQTTEGTEQKSLVFQVTTNEHFKSHQKQIEKAACFMMSN